MINHIVVVAVALWCSLTNARDFRLAPNEYLRYLLKSVNFALCFAGFCTKTSLSQASRAGKAAFLCCGYDVVTDWRSFGKVHFFEYERILKSMVTEDLVRGPLALYVADNNRLLKDDGLERGTIALDWIIRMMGVAYSDTMTLGRLLQIVDDVLDYEEDREKGQLNCLLSSRRDEYLNTLTDRMTDAVIKKLFPRGPVLSYVIRKARKKATSMLLSDKLGQHEFQVGLSPSRSCQVQDSDIASEA